MNKKIIFTAILGLVMAASFTSCKKDQTCKCTTSWDDTAFDATTSETKIKDTKKKAKTKCEAMSSTFAGSVTKCEIQ